MYDWEWSEEAPLRTPAPAPTPARRPRPPRRRRGWRMFGLAAVVAFLTGLVIGLVSNWFDAHQRLFLVLLGLCLAGWAAARARTLWLGGAGGLRRRDLGGGALALGLLLAGLGKVTLGVLLAVAAVAAMVVGEGG